MARANSARGFEVGFNAVDSVIRQSDARKERERRNQREDEKWSFEKDRLENERSYQREMADAGRAPEQGMAIGAPGAKNFAAGKADQQFLADQEASIADLEGRAPSAAQIAAGSGNQIMDRSDPRAQNTRAGYLARAADVQRQHGKMDESIKTEELANAIRKSGTIDSLDYLFASGGDAAGAQKIRESAMGPMGGTLIAEKTTRKGADGTEYPDFKLSVRDADGNVRELGSAMVMRYYAGNPAEYHKLLQSEAKGKRESDKDERTLAQGDRRLDIAQQQVTGMIQNWNADNEIQRARLGIERQRFADERDGGKLKREIEQVESVLGRKLTDTERLAKLGFKSEDGVKKFVDDVAKEWSKNNPEAKPGDVAAFRADLERRVHAAPVELEVEARIKRLPPDQRGPAIAEAQQRFGLNEAWFKERGIEMPQAQAPAAAPRAASIAAGGGGAPPAQKPPAAQIAARPREMGATETSYVNALAALRQQQVQLAQEAANAKPEAQADVSRRIAELGEHIRRTKEQARARGIVVE